MSVRLNTLPRSHCQLTASFDCVRSSAALSAPLRRYFAACLFQRPGTSVLTRADFCQQAQTIVPRIGPSISESKRYRLCVCVSHFVLHHANGQSSDHPKAVSSNARSCQRIVRSQRTCSSCASACLAVTSLQSWQSCSDTALMVQLRASQKLRGCLSNCQTKDTRARS